MTAGGKARKQCFLASLSSQGPKPAPALASWDSGWEPLYQS